MRKYLCLTPVLFLISALSGQSQTNTPLSLIESATPRITVTDRVWPEQAGQTELCLWHGDKLAAYSLTIDDNHAQDIPFWLELGDRYGWKWTWFLITGNGGNWADWKNLADNGHGIGSHSVTHLTTTLSIEQEYTDSQNMLRKNLPKTRPLVLAYPNGNQSPNNSVLAAQTYIAVRGVKGVLNPAATINYRDVNSVSGAQNFAVDDPWHWASFASLFNPKNKQNYRAWYSCHFHGISDGMKPAITEMLDLLKTHEADVWVGTFQQIAMYGQERDTATLKVISAEKEKIVLSLTDQMDNSVFTHPLTVKVRLDESWASVSAEQNRTEIPVKIIHHKEKAYALVDVIPDAGEITLTPAAAQSKLLAQPDAVPGNWDLKTPQNFQPLEKALQRTVPGNLVYGLYTWAGEYLVYRDDIQKIGWPSIRIAGPFHNTIMQALAEDEKTTMVTVGNWLLDPVKNANRTDYESDEALIADYIEKLDAFLVKYGPDGTFLKEHPELPKHPIIDVELWNEPNFQYLIPRDQRPWQEQEADKEALYAKILPALYAATKPNHPKANLIGFAAGGMSAGDLRFIQHVHEKNPAVAQSYDVLSTHPYVRPAAPEANSVQPWGSYSISRNLNIIKDTLKKQGRADTPVWYTEIGWPILPEDGGHFPTAKPQECVSPLLQAAYVCRTYALALRLNIERVHIMYVTDADHFNAGFFDKETKAWRPSAYAVQTMIKTMPNPKLTGSISDGTDGYYAYTYLADEGKGNTTENNIIMAWNVAGPKTIELTHLPEKVIVTDMLGAAQTRTTTDGTLSLDIGPYPVYLKPAP